jgi:DNA-binding PadR family transcriptional regulator
VTVRQSLLAILTIGPCYGYQLRAEFDRRTGSTWPLNVGQTYTTLERLERDGLVRRGGADDEGHLYWEITDAGRTAAGDWLARSVEPARGTRDELAIKIAIASTLPGTDAVSIVRSQRLATLARVASLRESISASAAIEDTSDATDAEALARTLVRNGLLLDAEAEVRWLEQCERILEERPAAPMPLTAEKPRRGRPAKTATAAPSLSSPSLTS